jgi:serine/threonine-protein kinase
MRGEINVSSPQPSFRSPDGYEPGQLIDGRYLLEEPLGEGGMGMVWKARHAVLNTPVAIKLVLPELRFTDVAQRLMLEAQVEAQLKHPNVVRVSDFGQTGNGDSFMVMELLSGRSLAKELELSGAMEPEQAVRLVLPLLDALAYAHASGIVHRDIKPENIFLSRSEAGAVMPKIVDFGIATQERTEEAEGRITCRGTLLGSPPYMPPEQALCCDVDHRADIWSMAVVLHEMISGRPLFEGTSCQAVLRQVVDSDVVCFRKGGEAAASLWPIVQRALEKDVDARVQSARELGIALAQWLLVRGVTTDSCGAELALAWSPEARAPRPVQLTFEAPMRSQLVAAQIAETQRQRAGAGPGSREDAPSTAPTLRTFNRRKTAWAGALATVVASLGLTIFTSFDRGRELPVAAAQAPLEPSSALIANNAKDAAQSAERAPAPAPAPAPANYVESTEGTRAVAEDVHAAPELAANDAQGPADATTAEQRASRGRLRHLGLKDPY